MIIGIGIDIIENERIAQSLSPHDGGFKQQVFSAAEIAYCEPLPHKVQHYAARFAAKEAFLKACGMGLTITVELHEIEVVHDSRGRPSLQLHGKLKELARENNWNRILVSISHIQEMACAVVTIEDC